MSNCLQILVLQLELKNLTPTATEIEKLNVEELFSKFNQPNVQKNDNSTGNNSDDDFVTRPPVSFKRTFSSREGNVSLKEMQSKLTRFEGSLNNLTSEVSSLKTTVTGMSSNFSLELSNLRETIIKEVSSLLSNFLIILNTFLNKDYATLIGQANSHISTSILICITCLTYIFINTYILRNLFVFLRFNLFFLKRVGKKTSMT